jgi:uncharacterized protein YihD (DUF1040 family)
MLIDLEFNIRETLLTNKGLPPLNQFEIEELKKIQALDVSGFTEADVRAEIIDPIVRILGYKKGQFSSVDREKHIRFLGKTHKYIDYSFTLWKENFWIIEAKRPLGNEHFGYNELSQATEYSIHPEINASIIVLCDGRKIELFDREENLEEPIVFFEIKNLVENIDLLRKILCPIHIWFFYKRRILRSIDKVFELEFNQARANEFLDIIQNRFQAKRGQILKNFQNLKLSESAYDKKLSNLTADDIIDIHYFFRQSISTMNSMNKILIDECKNRNIFSIIYKIFPDHYRDVNDSYYINALSFLLDLEKEIETIHWIPSWLSDTRERKTETIIKGLIKHSLNYFSDDEPRKIILLASSAFRRVFKILAILLPEMQKNSELSHLITRFNYPEISWNQVLSSPERSLLSDIDRLTLMATYKFTKEFSEEHHKFKSNMAKLRLQQIWLMEKTILENTPNYTALRQEKNLGEIHPTEASSVVYDSLGHGCLCVLKSNDKWKKYILDQHKDEIKLLAILGSWSAKELIASNTDNTFDDKTRIDIANRFFLGDYKLSESLTSLYNFHWITQ